MPVQRILVAIALNLAALGWAGVTPAVQAEDSPKEIPFTAISYNCQFLPGPAGAMNERKEPDYRAERIAQEVSKFDIIALQEVFDEKYQTLIAEGVAKAWGTKPYTYASPKPDGWYTGGGCLLLSRFPILARDFVVFEHFSKKEDYGFKADGFAAKGVIHARLALDPADSLRTIDLFVTHLEARADELRPLQYAEAAAFIQAQSDPARPALFLGDFNTRGTPEYQDDLASQYAAMMKTLSGARPGSSFTDTWVGLMGRAHGGTSEQESTETGKRIDYILFINPAAEDAPHVTPKTIRVEPYLDPETVALSDHSAVIAEFTVNFEGQPLPCG